MKETKERTLFIDVPQVLSVEVAVTDRAALKRADPIAVAETVAAMTV